MTGNTHSSATRNSWLAKSARRIAAIVAAGFIAACSAPSTDSIIEDFLERENIPGAALAIASQGNLVSLRSYGVADIDMPAPVTRDHRFRIASLSKPITAAAVLSLVERGDLRLEDRLADLLPQFDYSADAGLQEITVRHLLQHTAGWDRKQTFDPFFDLEASKRTLGLESANDCLPIAAAMLARPLQHRPGEHYVYSNLGYCFLALIIEQVAGQSYDVFTHDTVLRPHGIAHMQIGEEGTDSSLIVRHHLRLAGQLVAPGNPLAYLVSPDNLRVLGAAGGWTASIEELIRFFAQPVRPMTAIEPEYAWEGDNYYGLGWRVWPGPDGPDYTHFGAMPDAYSLAVKTHDGLTIVVLFNARPADDWQALDHLYEELTAAARREFGES